ncbi:MAG: hypothetical protein ACE367_05140 [Acidimicrobiales bacterium]
MSEIVNVDNVARAETAGNDAIRPYRPRPELLDGSRVPPVPEPLR